MRVLATRPREKTKLLSMNETIVLSILANLQFLSYQQPLGEASMLMVILFWMRQSLCAFRTRFMPLRIDISRPNLRSVVAQRYGPAGLLSMNPGYDAAPKDGILDFSHVATQLWGLICYFGALQPRPEPVNGWLNLPPEVIVVELY